MPNLIINNDTTTLKAKFQDLIPTSTEMKFLVGYFYFSAIPELYQELKAKAEKNDLKLRILVGLNSESIIVKAISGEGVEKFLSSVRENFCSEALDKKEFYDQYEDFIKWIKEGKIIIRKTNKDNHSKLYLFAYPKDGKDNRFITGSSNFTSAGLFRQDEFNVEVNHAKDYIEADEYFENLWRDAILITEDDSIKKDIIEILTKETHCRKVTPYEAYIYILKTYLSLDMEDDKNIPQILDKAGFKPFRFQIDAIREALGKIEDYGGVILGDVVGLGKSIIASVIATQLPGNTLILCPPNLIGEPGSYGWKDYKYKFNIRGEVESSSFSNLKYIYERKLYSDFDNVIIDEAHRFRNDKNDTYGYLNTICKNKKVILLTATPFNNTFWDIHSILKLFLPTKFVSASYGYSLFEKFMDVKARIEDINSIIKDYRSTDPAKLAKIDRLLSKYLPGVKVASIGKPEIDKLHKMMKDVGGEVKDDISSYIIRRNRLDILNNPDYKKETGDLSTIEDPREALYFLEPDLSDFYDDILRYFSKTGGDFIGAIYRPVNYDAKNSISKKLAKQYQDQLYDFMKRIIVKRLESSFGAFYESVKRYLQTNIEIYSFVTTNGYYVLNRKFMTDCVDLDDDEVLEKLKEMQAKKGKEYDVYEFTPSGEADFLEDIKKDIDLFTKIKERCEDLKMVDKDPKFEELVKIVDGIKAKEPNRKILVFTEFADTVKHLRNKFDGLHRDDIDYVYGSSIKIEEIEKEFDYSCKDQTNDKHILVSTDKMSEGHNLNRAGVVINYDIPWNPVRVIQRVGRMNRISAKVFDKLYIYNFFPSELTSDTVRVKQIATQKMLLIHNILGEDAKIFTPDEEPTAAELSEALHKLPYEDEEESFYTYVRKLYKSIEESTDPKVQEALKNIDKMPYRIKTCKLGTDNELILFILKNDMFVRHFNFDTSKSYVETKLNKDLIDKIKCDPDTPLETFSDNFWNMYPKLIDVNAGIRHSLPKKGDEEKAYNTLKSLEGIIKKDRYHSCAKYKDFIKALIDDITGLGTLSTFDYRKIKDWKDDDKLEAKITELYEDLGKSKYINSINRTEEKETKIIVGYENKKH